jgi:hypothetical protein
MTADDSKIFIPARHGLGDVIAHHFLPQLRHQYNPTCEVLAKTQYGLERGIISEAMVIYESFYTASTGDLFRALPFGIKVMTTGDFGGEVAVADHDNRMPAVVRGFRNVRTNPPPYWGELKGSPSLELPTIEPKVELPKKYILFSPFASASDRTITDPLILEFIREIVGLPVVLVGKGNHAFQVDVDLCNRTHICETAWLAQRAGLIVAGLTFFRVFGPMYQVPVIEIAQHGRMAGATFNRTCREYEANEYGIQRGLVEWYIWPQDKDRMSRQIKKVLGL